jgi:hypothetical protein
MNIALILQHKLMLGIQRFIVGAPAPVMHAPLRVRSHTLPVATVRLANPGGGAGLVSANMKVNTKVMPLRVLRVVETGQPRSCTGRLVISGRMADVCAELDRLVEREAALH